MLFRITYLVLIFFCAQNSYGQNNDKYYVQRINGKITIDGLSNETAWQGITPLPLTLYQPTFQGTPTERTEIRIAYDDEYIYVGARLYDSDPSGIRTNSLYRDRDNNDDFLNTILDTYNDNETALGFGVTPAGTRFDGIFSNDAEGSFSDFANFNWNTFWDAEAVINEEGWFAEVRIPFSSLQFQDVNGRVEMGLIVHRMISRKNERITFPAIPPQWNAFKPSKAHDIVFEGIFRKKPVYITPYGLGSYSNDNILNDAGTGYRGEDDGDGDFGFDIKYGITSNLTFDATVNTDFAQVEADDEQVNLSRFSLFFPEKRQFFQERSSIFDFNTGGDLSKLFHSRRVGLTEDGREVRIFGGARLVGRVGEWDLGFLDMQTEEISEIPSENFGVLRMRRRILNPFSYVGGMITNKLGDDGSYNTAVGLDGIFNIRGDDYVSYNWAQTFERNQSNSFFDRGRIRLLWERRKIRGFNFRSQFTSSGRFYNPEMGFVRRSDFSSLGNNLSYAWNPDENSLFRTYSINFVADAFVRNNDDELESLFVGPFISYDFKSGANMFFNGWIQRENITKGFGLSGDTAVPAGKYTFGAFDANYDFAPGKLFRPGIYVSAGSYYDGNIAQAVLKTSWFQSSHLELSINYSVNRISFSDRDQKFVSHLSKLKLNYALDRKFSASSFLQFNSTTDKVITNIRIRYNFSEGNDLFLVYNEQLNSDRDRNRALGVPRLPLSDNRTAIIKYSRTFIK